MPTRRMTEARQKDADDRGPALELLVQALLGVGRADPAAVQLGEREVGQQVRLGIGEQPGDGRHARFQGGDDP